MGFAAMKGNRFVQKTLTDMVAKMEADHHSVRFELFGRMVEYKHKWHLEIERCRKARLPDLKMLPHRTALMRHPAVPRTRPALWSAPRIGARAGILPEAFCLRSARRIITGADRAVNDASRWRAGIWSYVKPGSNPPGAGPSPPPASGS